MFILCLTLCFVPLSACGKADKPVPVERTSEIPVQLNEEHKDNITRISGVLQKDEGLYFANSLEDFIDCYNDYYYKGSLYTAVFRVVFVCAGFWKI